VQRLYRLDDPQARVHGAPGIVFVRLGVAKIHQQAIPEVLGDMAVKALADRCGCGLVSAYDLAVVFRVQVA
jgi:hypothetical protein